ncbi:MAG TPA: cytochrome c [Acidobacteriaceae bacterium]|jgi:mono/diheme cytochrome c family protein|nr:cytochrome c [Acidobacteriaceae bacterium]
MKFILGLLIGLLIIPVGVWIYLRAGHPPIAVADHPFPFEKQIVRVPLNARIRAEMSASAPIEASATNLTTGAQIYRQQCAACHGLYGRPSDFGVHMYPNAPQLWKPHRNGVVGVSDDPVGETYWKVANGIRLTGMPSFEKTLNQTQMWQVSLLLKNAGSPMPPEVDALISTPLDFAVPANAPAGTAQH